MGDIVLLDRFFSQVQLHLVSCYQEVPQWPVILGIFGRSGDGKSAQLVASLRRCEVEVIRLNAADLESGLAGEPGKHLARTYATASLAVAKDVPTAIVLDDIDTTVGEWEMNTGTVNHQQVLAELMHIADRPVDLSRNHPRKVPVFVTGNNLARLYPPLRRPGRMRSMPWRPTSEELTQVVLGLFRDVASPAELADFAGKFPNETLAFFAEVRQTLREVEITRNIGNARVDMRKLLSLRQAREQSELPPMRMPGQELVRLAEAVRNSRDAALEDFLKEPDRR